MSNIEDYNASISAIEAIPDADAKTPAIPVDVYIQEAEDVHHWCQDDKEALKGAGLNWADVVNAIPVRAGAARYAQSIWVKERRTRELAQKEWDEKAPGAYKLQNELVHTFHFAYRKHPDLLGRVSEINDGTGDADMIQDLSDLSVLGKAYPEPLALTNFDTTKLDTADTLADELAVILAAANGDKLQDNKAKNIRDKAYTYLKEAVDELRDFGKFVFWQNKDRYQGYISQYWKKKSRAQQLKKDATEE